MQKVRHGQTPRHPQAASCSEEGASFAQKEAKCLSPGFAPTCCGGLLVLALCLLRAVRLGEDGERKGLGSLGAFNHSFC